MMQAELLGPTRAFCEGRCESATASDEHAAV